MAIQPGIERYNPNKGVNINHHPVNKIDVAVGGRIFSHWETADFPKSDPWSMTMRGAVSEVRAEGGFLGQEVTEFGVGDGINLLEAGSEIKHGLGVDIEQWRVEVAAVNLLAGPARLKSVELWRGDAVEFLQNLQDTGRDKLPGWVFMCLPQSPSGINLADKYDGSATLNPYRADFDKSGLTLNAATLDSLRSVSTKTTRALVIISDRVPPEITREMFLRTGWQIVGRFGTPEPIQQDPDTGIDWVERIDDGRRFYELIEPGKYSPISAIEAEKRRLASLASGKLRDELNVHHNLTVYRLGVK